jgi:GR25 family glycosyltransferase involved in LPS biosynthesis
MSQPDRLRNIEIQSEKLGNNIINVDAVVGKTIDLDDLIKRGVLTSNVYDNKGDMFTRVFEKRKNEIGCYLSHLKTYDLIRDSNNKKKTIIATVWYLKTILN